MPKPSEQELDEIVERTRAWLERAVVGLNLCPFAKAVHVKKQIRYTVSTATDGEVLLATLVDELNVLRGSDPAVVETTLLIHPYVLNDFFDYNDFLGEADAILAGLGLEGEIQIASFHPDYQFADTTADDITNYTNRSPYPILHLLREASIERAIEAYPDASAIFDRNKATLKALGLENWHRLLEPGQCGDGLACADSRAGEDRG